jgi:hypothetical protein
MKERNLARDGNERDCAWTRGKRWDLLFYIERDEENGMVFGGCLEAVFMNRLQKYPRAVGLENCKSLSVNYYSL